MRHNDNFNRISPVLNSLSFSKAGCHTNIKEPNLPYYLPMFWIGNSYMHTFPKGINVVWNTDNFAKDLN